MAKLKLSMLVGKEETAGSLRKEPSNESQLLLSRFKMINYECDD